MNILEQIILAAPIERVDYIQTLEAAARAQRRIERDPDFVAVFHAMRRNRAQIGLQEYQKLRDQVSYLDRSIAIIASLTETTDLNKWEQSFKARKALTKSGRLDWERIYKSLLQHSQSRVDSELKNPNPALRFTPCSEFNESWKKNLWFSPEFLAAALDQIAPGRVRAELSF